MKVVYHLFDVSLDHMAVAIKTRQNPGTLFLIKMTWDYCTFVSASSELVRATQNVQRTMDVPQLCEQSSPFAQCETPSLALASQQNLLKASHLLHPLSHHTS